MATKYHVSFIVTPDTDETTARAVEAAEEQGRMTLEEAAKHCRALNLEAKLYRAQGFAGWMESDGNWVLE